MVATGFYKKINSQDGINGHRNVTMMRYGVHIEIVAEAVAEDKWKVIDIFAFRIAEKAPRW